MNGRIVEPLSVIPQEKTPLAEPDRIYPDQFESAIKYLDSDCDGKDGPNPSANSAVELIS
jgi:hypothetical protein